MIVICCKCGNEYDLDNIFEVKGEERPVLVCPHCDLKHFIDFLPFENKIAIKKIKILKLGVEAPTVTTQACTDVSYNTATGNGNITATGGANCTTRGFCYMAGTSGDPTTANSTVFDTGSFDTGAYTKAITGLTAETNYRVRAYAINSVGTGYGTTVQITTDITGTWLSPTGHEDGDNVWDNEELAYDENNSTYAATSVAITSWSSYLELTCPIMTCSKVRFSAYYNVAYINSISLDVYYSGAWHNIYEGVFVNNLWNEKAIGSIQTVTAMRAKFYNTYSTVRTAGWYEADFWGVAADTVINIAAIPGVTAPETDATPVTVITETDQYTGTVTWDPAHNPFQASTVYTATITLTPKAGFTLTGVAENFFTVDGAIATNPINSGVVTAVFPETEAAGGETQYLISTAAIVISTASALSRGVKEALTSTANIVSSITSILSKLGVLLNSTSAITSSITGSLSRGVIEALISTSAITSSMTGVGAVLLNSIANISVVFNPGFDIGNEASDRTYSMSSRTVIDAINPANATGRITSVEIWADRNMSSVKVATFYRPDPDNYPLNFSTRDYQSIGAVTAGAKRTFEVDLDVVTGDYLGIYYSSGTLDQDVGGDGQWNTYPTDNIPCDNVEFVLTANRTISLYGTGVGGVSLGRGIKETLISTSAITTSIIASLSRGIKETLTSTSAIATSITSALSRGITQTLTSATNIVISISGNLSRGVKEALTSTVSITTSITSALSRGITQALTSTVNIVSSITATLKAIYHWAKVSKVKTDWTKVEKGKDDWILMSKEKGDTTKVSKSKDDWVKVEKEKGDTSKVEKE